MIKRSVTAHASQFLSSQSDEVRYRASLLIEILNAVSSFDSETIAIEQQEDVQKEMQRMEEARKEMTTMNEKESAKEEKPAAAESDDGELNLAGALENEAESAKEETPKEETPKEETPKEEVPKEETPKEEVPKEEAQLGIHHLSELLSRLTEELMPVSAKAQKKVKIPEGLDLDTPITSLALEVGMRGGSEA